MATYRDAGVDLDAADDLVDRIKPAVTKTWHEGVVGGFGGFAAGISMPPGYDDPVLMMSTDGVGTKAEIARATDRLDGLGWDLVAMCIDDLAAAGARPIAMTDYLAVGVLDVAQAERLVTSVAAACAAADVALLGGETAEHPGVMAPGEFDLAGAALGVVERGHEVDGSAIAAGNVVVGVASPNLRSNGFSLVRAVLAGHDLADPLPGMDVPAAETLLAPSVLYTPQVMQLLAEVPVAGMAHVTGGGLPSNTARILPADCDAAIDTGAWDPPAVFASIAALGAIAPPEMFRTFNMGVGFVVVVDEAHADRAVGVLSTGDRDAFVIGEITTGAGVVRLTGV